MQVQDAPSVTETATPPKSLPYPKLVERIQEVVRTTLPSSAIVAVISKGDSRLLELGGRQAWHFPRRDDGAYAGYYPADSAAAITHLEGVRAAGADFLLIPATAQWWLDYYGGFRQHLEGRYRSLVRQDGVCRIFALREATSPRFSTSKTDHLRYQGLIEQIRSVVSSTLPPDARILVLTKGDEALLKLEGRAARHFPQDANGGHSGYNPADSEEAIGHLEALRSQGAEFLVFPSTEAWWLVHYEEFRRHLQERYRLAVYQRHVCLIFDLTTQGHADA
jgi:hypothetical protein